MENSNNSRPYILAIVVAVIIVGLIIVRTLPANPNDVTDGNATSTHELASSTDLVAPSSEPTVTAPTTSVVDPSDTVTAGPVSSAPVSKSTGLNFSTITAKNTYSQNEQIPIVIQVDNQTGKEITLSFPNGCQVSYSVESFDSLQHTRCLPEASTLIIPAHGSKQLGVVHYPALYKITEGPTAFIIRVIGYGTITVPFTITK